MVDRSRASLERSASHFRVDRSQLAWDGESLSIDVDEPGAVLPLPVKGRIRLTPLVRGQAEFQLDPAGRHVWRPIAPRARVTAEFDTPGIAWSGHGYWDHNHGDEALEDGFSTWHWSRAHRARDTAVVYEGQLRSGARFAMALAIDEDGEAHPIPLGEPASLPRTWWRMERATRADPGHWAHVRATWEDTPFYARSAIATRLGGEDVMAVHESLSLDRFASGAVQWMLPWRMKRRP
jgi:carotenoid 1,2-hydratase